MPCYSTVCLDGNESSLAGDVSVQRNNDPVPNVTGLFDRSHILTHDRFASGSDQNKTGARRVMTACAPVLL